MGTSNFYNHENGIFVIEPRDFDEVKKFMIEEEELEEVSDEMVYEDISFYFDIDIEDTISNIKYDLENKGYSLNEEDNYRYTVYNKGGKMVAELEVRSGYYSGAQIIVETDPNELFIDDHSLYFDERTQDYSDDIVKSRLNEVYTPYSATLFNIIKRYTNSYGLVGTFSNGESVYTKV